MLRPGKQVKQLIIMSTLSPSSSEVLPVQRWRLRVRGSVQGVGFRPFVYRLATGLGLTGWVHNDGGGVVIEIQGTILAEFVAALRERLPVLAQIQALDILLTEPVLETGFEVRSSTRGTVSTLITPDQAVCADCLEELFDPADRRYAYPFINCTNCGPRYTLTHCLPYDRANTSMAAFVLCVDCAREYQDPKDRRFHAEPTACPDCGPNLDLSIAKIVERIRVGEILAIKGLGGYHLVCDARNQTAVARLRRSKQRDYKPFAVMAANIASVQQLAYCNAQVVALLMDSARPIVVLESHNKALPAELAPQLPWLGVMLPYTPIHYLLFHEAAGRPTGTQWLQQTQDLVLVMTSANPGGKPLVISNLEAQRQLAGIADSIVTHDRDIVIRADDSVARVIDGAPLFIRRARGQVPTPIRLAEEVPPVLAVGGQLKNTICITRGAEAFVSQHIGDLDNLETIEFFEDTVAHLLSLLDVTPQLVAHDLHADFHSTRFARSLGIPAVAVQHHHAHIAAVAAEHGFTEPVLGLALDGFGLGTDQTNWGGELLWVNRATWQRWGHLTSLPQPGGDVAARQPWRMAAAALHQLGQSEDIGQRFADQPGSTLLAAMLKARVNSPPTSSCGRWFDAACGILGIVPLADYEGQAPMVLEGMVTQPEVVADGWRLEQGRLDLSPLLVALLDCSPQQGANRFHGTLIAALTEWVSVAAAQTGIRHIMLGGGCFLNAVLTRGLIKSLTAAGLQPKLPRCLPPNDGGLSLGQCWIATDPAAVCE